MPLATRVWLVWTNGYQPFALCYTSDLGLWYTDFDGSLTYHDTQMRWQQMRQPLTGDGHRSVRSRGPSLDAL